MGDNSSEFVIGVSSLGNGVTAQGLNNLYCGVNYPTWNFSEPLNPATYNDYLHTHSSAAYYAALPLPYFASTPSGLFSNCKNVCIKVTSNFGTIVAQVVSNFSTVVIGNDIGLYGENAWEIIDPTHHLPVNVTWEFIACPSNQF